MFPATTEKLNPYGKLRFAPIDIEHPPAAKKFGMEILTDVEIIVDLIYEIHGADRLGIGFVDRLDADTQIDVQDLRYRYDVHTVAERHRCGYLGDELRLAGGSFLL